MGAEKLRNEGQGQTAAGPRHARVGDLVLKLIEQALSRDWSAILGRIEAIDQATLRAKVRPLLRLPVEKGKTVPLGIIYEVPVDVERAGPFYTRHPYRVKDIVILIVNDRSLENTIKDHEPHDPKIDHVSALEDVIVLGGFRADADNTYPAAWTKDLLIQNDETKDTEIWYEKGGVQRYLSGEHAGYSYRMDAKYKVLIQSLWKQVILHAAEKIMLGMKDEYHALLAEPVIATYNEHCHACPSGQTFAPIQKMSLSAHASGLVWLQKDPAGKIPFPYVEGTSPPGCKGCGYSCGGLGCLTCGQDVVDYILSLGGGIDLSKLGEAIANAAEAIANFIAENAPELFEIVADALGKAREYLVDAVWDALVEMIGTDPLSWLTFVARIFTDPVGLLTEFVMRVANKVTADLTGVDLEAELAKLLDKAADWTVDKAMEAVGMLAEELGIEGAKEFAAKLAQAIDDAGEGNWETAAQLLIESCGGDPNNDMLVTAVAWVMAGVAKALSSQAAGAEASQSGGGGEQLVAEPT